MKNKGSIIEGFFFTDFFTLSFTQNEGLPLSMSRRGNPYDNALAENFFAIPKTECIDRIKLKTYDEARLIIDEYIDFTIMKDCS